MRCPALVAPSAAWLLSLSNVDDFSHVSQQRQVSVRSGFIGPRGMCSASAERQEEQGGFWNCLFVPHIALDRRTNTGHSHAALLTQLKLKTHSLHHWALSGRVPYDSTAVPFPASHRAQLYHRPGSLIAT
ncbi:hypothetical protein C8F04DRAFT_1261102 [Mycena alexandri]|uniref:Uncharacterized protein n=1 Tax=Mycena alexandri TaxID=1745969 RepID=A0AAD6SSK0_9AGAR|nr:hypothetical protein C8F04DRAFT_1261102 [Mycena alexandri]